MSTASEAPAPSPGSAAASVDAGRKVCRVSRRRRVAGIVALALAAAPYALYARLTDDEFVRDRAEALLSRLSGGEVEIAAAHFSAFSGLTLTGVRIRTPFDAAFHGSAAKAPREIFEAGQVRVVVEPWSLLAGRMVVQSIIASAPMFTVVYHAEQDRYNWSLLRMEPAPSGAPRGHARSRPALTLRAAQVRVFRIEASGTSGAPAYELDADASPHPVLSTAYLVDYRVYNDSPHRGRGLFDPNARRVRGTPFVPYASVREALPNAYRRHLDALELAGRFRLEELDYADGGASPSRLELTVEEVSGAVTLPLDGEDTGTATRYTPLWFTGARGNLSLRGERIELDLDAQINGAACRISGCIDGVDLPEGQQGMDVHVDWRGLVLPEGAERSSLLSDPSVPRRVKALFWDYDPHGTVDLKLDIRRPRGAGQRVDLSGDLVSIDCTASHKDFPYRLTQVAGVVTFEGDERVRIRDLKARRGAATVRVSGEVIQPSSWSGVDVEITGTSVPLDQELYAALPRRYQELWRLFSLDGTVSTRVHLARPLGDSQRGARPWETSLRVSFEAAQMQYRGFPYAVTDVHGDVSLGPELIEVHELSGRAGSAPVRASGWATDGGNGQAELEVDLEAEGLRLDADVLAALPPGFREAVRELHLDGRADVRGRLYRPGGSAGEVGFDLVAYPRGATLCFERFALPVQRLEGHVRIEPSGVTESDLTGYCGEGVLRLRGTVSRDNQGHVVDLNVEARDMLLDDRLHAALPTEVRRVWEAFAPRGRVDATSNFYERVRDGVTSSRHRTELTLRSGRLCYALFPLPLRDVQARLLLDGPRTDILSLQAVAEIEGPSSRPATEVSVTGSIVAGTSPPRCDLTLALRGAPLDAAELRRALPASLGEAFERLALCGTADLHLQRLVSEADPHAASVWTAIGDVTLRDAGLNLGMRLDDVNGKMAGWARMQEGRVVVAEVDADLRKLDVGHWPLESVNGRVMWSSDGGRLRVRNVTGRVFGGELSGTAELQWPGGQMGYTLTVALADAALAEFARAHGVGVPSDRPVRGRVDGRISVRSGASGWEAREGMGEIVLSDAQVWRLPLVLAIFRVLHFAPDENAFDQGRVQFYLMGDKLKLTAVDLRGPSVSLLGGGWLDLRNHALDLALVAGPPQRLDVPVLSELLETAAQELMEVRVRGTLTEPRITAQPLRSVAALLEELFGRAAAGDAPPLPGP